MHTFIHTVKNCLLYFIHTYIKHLNMHKYLMLRIVCFVLTNILSGVFDVLHCFGSSIYT